MKVSGFTFVRNAIKYDYPVVEAITSILPLCDEVVVAVGKSEDETLKMIQDIPSSKIRVIETIWDDNLREQGQVLAVETNKAMDTISSGSDWAFYIQADEIIHEKDHDSIKSALVQFKDEERVQGLLFHYYHFYGSYDYIGDSRQWYRNEIRIIKNDPNIRSYKDAMGFRRNGKKLCVKPIDAYIYHYGWVKHPHKQQQKQLEFHKMWHDDSWVRKNVGYQDDFDYSKINSVQPFTKDHPSVMHDRILKKNWDFDFHPNQIKLSCKDYILSFIEKRTGYRLGEYKNYNII